MVSVYTYKVILLASYLAPGWFLAVKCQSCFFYTMEWRLGNEMKLGLRLVSMVTRLGFVHIIARVRAK